MNSFNFKIIPHEKDILHISSNDNSVQYSH